MGVERPNRRCGHLDPEQIVANPDTILDPSPRGRSPAWSAIAACFTFPYGMPLPAARRAMPDDPGCEFRLQRRPSHPL
jgi:hypothetical protein